MERGTAALLATEVLGELEEEEEAAATTRAEAEYSALG